MPATTTTTTKNTRALWDLTRGQRLRFLAALVALALGAGLMYVGPQIVRLAIDGVLIDVVGGTVHAPVPHSAARALTAIDAAHHPIRALIIAGCGVFAATLLGGC